MTNEDLEDYARRPLSAVSSGPIKEQLLESINLLDNYTRGRVAEVVVAHLLGAKMVGDGYGDWDLDFLGHRIEVKASGEIQSWPQNKASRVSFGIARTEGYEQKSDGSYRAVRQRLRRSDAYVFCHHAGTKPDDPAEWTFYVSSTVRLNEACGDQKSIGLSSLLNSVGAARATSDDLAEVVRSVLPIADPEARAH